jgi:3'-phosphoadenosine 5'-phosphosulfate sulfotransferase (PAPS reductase)/FAD synthetase
MKILIFFSGGKDSQASLIWAVLKYGVNNCEAVFCDTGWEHPQTYEHINTVTKQLGVNLVTLKSSKYDGMIDLAKKKGRFPSTKARFCTEELKSKPAIDYVLSHQEHLIVIEGIRKNESFSRSKMEPECAYFRYYFEPMANGKKHSYRGKEVRQWCKEWNADRFRPIFDWTAEMVMDYILLNGQTPNPLYYQGFGRVGCFPCIMARHKEIMLIAENHPQQMDKLRDAENQVGKTFFPPNYIPARFCQNKQYPTIEDVEKYLSEKNATLDMFDDGGQPGCMSMYGLCE